MQGVTRLRWSGTPDLRVRREGKPLRVMLVDELVR